jgi:hypothetical protein
MQLTGLPPALQLEKVSNVTDKLNPDVSAIFDATQSQWSH